MNMKFTLSLVTILYLTLILSALSIPDTQAAEPNLKEWQPTALVKKTSESYCLDTGRPEKLVIFDYDAASQQQKETYLADFNTGQRTLLNNRPYGHCGTRNGVLFARTEDYAEGGAYRFSSLEPGERKIDYFPTFVAQDGSRYLYYFSKFYEYPNNNLSLSKLMVSSNSGDTWQERGKEFNGQIRSFAVSSSDGRAAYALVQETGPIPEGTRKFSIYLTRDAGISWKKQYESSANYDYSRAGIAVWLFAINDNPYTPVGVIGLEYESGGFGSSNHRDIHVSTNGGLTFNYVGLNAIYSGVRLFYTGTQLLRVPAKYMSGPNQYSLESSSDSGKTWQKINVPNELLNSADYNNYVDIGQSPVTPSVLYLSRKEGLFVSTDAGYKWRKLANHLKSPESETGTIYLPYMTPYAPSRFYTTDKDGRFYTLDVSEFDRAVTNAEEANNQSEGNFYFPETGHNLSYLFKQYWLEKGGLMQFGYPRTAAFFETNPADGKIYLAQYLERNRFEYHPELAGTEFEVLLGLLGNQITAPLRAAGHGAFNHFPDMQYPGGRYFSETGHNLRNAFKQYWENNGGLFIYGYPISEEYYEVNPDDGKTYVVQYFERARFEWHPELAGTRFEVLLGLLGNALLRGKGWL
jgi:hypothetical protein